ncbi:FAD-dependent monooxygenase [Amycolatopsis cynarae]|uniref:FAD-dependent monooxygenase n=1 Tax=Amycolatopsis cynarae TaxID=2995223 RepID=A0ABY7BB23_9PSEU|nr:FAD-dependent monooxygenase [Amycolatopsis sp. HUAS 11-8]WAL69351.1 FAD-dependent monooxygenase [Amycolatopsis sp. HUAS 11-8]
MTTNEERVPVLIVGGGYAGLAASLFLAHHGVRSLLVDRHPGPPMQGRARGINVRTLEIYRALGLDGEVTRAGEPFEQDNGVAMCGTLADQDWQWLFDKEAPKSYPEHSAGQLVMADQNAVEPILASAAVAKGADQRFGTSLVSFEADSDGVSAVVEDHASGTRRSLRADYLIAADGNRSAIRERLGIARPGYRVTQPLLSILFEADLSAVVRQRALFWIIRNPEIGFGGFVSTAVPGRWCLALAHDPEAEPVDSVTVERCERAVRAAAGIPDLPVRIVDVGGWQEAVGVAETYRQGRVFLVGDAAHVWPPAGAMGANSAVQDAHNLAWKLAAVLRGQAGPALLDSYEAERRPVALALADLTLRRQEARFGGGRELADVDDEICILGQRYRSSAVLGAPHDTVFGETLDTAALPGMRAPHLWVERDGERLALHDLLDTSFVLLTGASGDAWHAAAAAGSVPMTAYRMGVELTDVDGKWPVRSGLPADGALLVRPDGYVAWRAEGVTADPQETLATALRGILGTA